MEARKQAGGGLGAYLRGLEWEQPGAEEEKRPAKNRPTMREAIIWSELIMPPLSKRKKTGSRFPAK